uniref:Hexosyltransferase n=1 Tax=Steinernema glaseri TaxID=37863 RepID=A0A1I8A5I2_9BILA
MGSPSALIPPLVVFFLVSTIYWNAKTLISTPCRGDAAVKIRKLHLNDSDVDNVVILKERIKWPKINIRPKRLHLDRNLSFLIVVHSGVHNFERRYEMRTVLSKKIRKQNNFDIVFVTGRPTDRSTQDLLQAEADVNDDILQSTVAPLNQYPTQAEAWISYVYENFRNSTRFILKVDDDVFINEGLVANFLASRSHSESQKSIYCYPFKIAADKRPWRKHYLTEAEFPFRNLGIFCAGLAYTLSADLLPHLYKNVQRTRFVWLDDWYVTHALLVDVNPTIYDISPFYFSSESAREAFSRLRQVLVGDLPAPWFAHLRPRQRFDRNGQLDFWQRSQLCSEKQGNPVVVTKESRQWSDFINPLKLFFS